MKSKTFCFDRTILKRMFLKGLPLWGGYLLIWFVLLPMMLYNSGRYEWVIDLRDHILSAAAQPSQLFGSIYGLLSACFVFSWLYKSRSANFFGALPLNRRTLFWTCYLAGLLFAVGPHLAIVLMTAPLAPIWGWVLLKDLAIWFASMTLSYLFYYSLAVAVGMVVGNLLALPVLYGIVNFTAIVVEAVVRCLLEYFVYGVFFGRNFLFAWASPLYYTLFQGDGLNVRRVWDDVDHVSTDLIFEGWSILLILGAVGVVFAVLAYFLYRNRRMEAAGDVIAVNHLKPVILYCFTVGCSMVLGYVLSSLLLDTSIGTEDFTGVTVCMLVGGFAGYFGGQMLLQKSMRVFGKRYWRNWAVVSAAIVAVLICIRLDVFGYAHYIPDPDEVEAVSFGYGGDFYDDPMFMNSVKEFHQDCLDHQRETERMNPQDGYHRVYLSYKLKDDRLVERQYLLPISEELVRDENSLISTFERLYNDPAYKIVRSLPREFTAKDIERCEITRYSDGKVIYLSSQEAYDFVKSCLEPDIRETVMQTNCFCGYHYPENQFTDINVEVVFRERVEEQEGVNRYYHFGVSIDAHRILDYAAEKGVVGKVVK